MGTPIANVNLSIQVASQIQSVRILRHAKMVNVSTHVSTPMTLVDRVLNVSQSIMLLCVAALLDGPEILTLNAINMNA